ncbi:MAG: SDR family NAD(P)-dependent oxidoreductase [Spirochaetes bacterium]|nr:SDR family NAD(P)-dependent oxidoreductase [Spirochaetota bacterium]
MNNKPVNNLRNTKAVLVTGSSSGIGYSIAVYLAEQGFLVLAAVRKESDAIRLKELKIPTLIPVYPLDLTNPGDIESTCTYIINRLKDNKIKGLFGIVNVAGGGSIAPLELLDLDGLHRELKTRILGPIALLQSMLPLIREAKGRILWIATPALLPLPFLTDIHACDFAVNFIVRTLKIELLKWNIPGILIRCGGIKTSSPERTMNAFREAVKKWPEEKYDLYKDALNRQIVADFGEFDKKRTEPVEVAKKVYKALTDRKPKRRYRVGYMSGFAALLELFPQTVVDSILERKYR